MTDDVYDVWMDPARNLTDAELSRQEWIEERIAIMVESGIDEKKAKWIAVGLWLQWNKERSDDEESTVRM